LVGFTELVMAVLLVVILVLRPSGIMGGRELRWPAALGGRSRAQARTGAGEAAEAAGDAAETKVPRADV
jgi:hypothetical protein